MINQLDFLLRKKDMSVLYKKGLVKFYTLRLQIFESELIYLVLNIVKLLQMTLICPINIRPEPIGSTFRHDKKVKIEHFLNLSISSIFSQFYTFT